MHLSPATFRNLCLYLSFGWFVILYPVLNTFFWEALPQDMRSGGGDFGQYYSAALAVKTDINSSLYPEPKSAIYSQPPTFTPKVSSFLFDPDPSGRQGKWSFYPQIGYPDSSVVSPQLLSLCPNLQQEFHFVAPPPAALLLYPLSFFSYANALKFWFALMSVSLFGASFYAARIADHLFSKVTYASGIAALLPIIPTLLASRMATNLPVGNISPLMALLITVAAHSFLLRKQVALGFCMILLIIFKGMALFWCPLLLLGKPKWITLAKMAILTLAINLATLAAGGVDIYKHFFSEILPKASIPLGNGIPGLAMAVFGVDLSAAASVMHVAFALLVYLMVFLLLRQGADEGKTLLVAIACLTGLFNLLNPIQWSTYLTYHLIIPFSSLFIYYLYQIRPYSTKEMSFIIATVLSILIYWSDKVIFGQTSLARNFLESHGAMPDFLSIIIRSIYLFSIFGLVNILTFFLLTIALAKACSIVRCGQGAHTEVN